VRSTRRKLILGFFSLLGLAPPSLPWLGGRGQEARAAPPGGGADSARRTLSGAELDTLVAFAEMVVEGRPFSAAERAALLEHLADRAAEPSGYYLDLYRTTARLLDRLARARFPTLAPDQRRALLSRYRLMSATVRPGEPLGPHPNDAREVRTRAVPDLIAGYYRSPVGWAVVGYTTFPGRCGDLARYTTSEP
jgi:hypothetical protein